MNKGLLHLLMKRAVALCIACVTTAIAGAAVSPNDIPVIRSAFMLGFAYASAHNIYAHDPELGRQSQSAYDSFAMDVSMYAQSLGVQADTKPPSVDKSRASDTTAILIAGRRQFEILAIKIATRHGDAVIAASDLGYRVVVGIEYVPNLDSVLQAKEVANYEGLAGRAGCTREIIAKYTKTLVSTGNRERLVAALFAFKDDVLRLWEDVELSAKTGTRRQTAIWQMGWKLGLATLGQAQGADPSAVDGLFEESRAYAEALGVQLPALPEAYPNSPRDMAHSIHYMLKEVGDDVGGKLKNRYGPRSEALFELALKSTLALILYGPDDDLGQVFAEVIERSGRESGLPASVYSSLVQKIRLRKPYKEVKEGIIALNDLVMGWIGGRSN